MNNLMDGSERPRPLQERGFQLPGQVLAQANFLKGASNLGYTAICSQHMPTFLLLLGDHAEAKAKCLVLDRESFNLLLGPLKDIIEAHREGRQRPERTAPEAQGCDLAGVQSITPLIRFPLCSRKPQVAPK